MNFERNINWTPNLCSNFLSIFVLSCLEFCFFFFWLLNFASKRIDYFFMFLEVFKKEEEEEEWKDQELERILNLLINKVKQFQNTLLFLLSNKRIFYFIFLFQNIEAQMPLSKLQELEEILHYLNATRESIRVAFFLFFNFLQIIWKLISFFLLSLLSFLKIGFLKT